jgi:PAS domain S-box-containing protein
MNNNYGHTIDSAIMLESMTESVLITTSDLDAPGPYIVYVNGSFEKMTGWHRDEIIGKNPRILQGPDTDLGIFHNMREKLSGGEIWSGRTLNYRKDGSEFYMEWSIVPVINDEGIIYQFLAVQKDVTNIVITEQRLQEVLEDERKRLLEIEITNRKLNKLIARQNKTLNLFKKYVPEPIMNKALRQKDEDIRKGQKLDAALLFCDIRNFTPIAERLAPAQVVNLLNIYYSMMSEVINRYNGVINQFVGDEIFVSFGAPEAIQDPEISSVKCAIDMVQKLDEISNKLKSIIPERIVVGIGIHFGPIVAGNLGSDDRLAYSITGDTVNTAKRIESLSRELPNAILISQAIYNKTNDFISTKPWGEVHIKGKNEKINVFQVIDNS